MKVHAGKSARAHRQRRRLVRHEGRGLPGIRLLLHAARALGRPVKWTDERSGSFVSDHHGRDHELPRELALDAEGIFLAVRLTGYGNLGAFLGADVAACRRRSTSCKNLSASTARR